MPPRPSLLSPFPFIKLTTMTMHISIVAIFFQCLILLSISQALTNYNIETYMVDMNTDPFEQNDMLKDMSETTEQVLTRMQERIEYWRQHVGTVETPNVDLKKSSWKRAGGIVPWIEDETYVRETPPLKYSNPSAPHIVFILIDDWGWNDIGYQSTWLSWTTPTVDRLAQQGIKLSNYWTSCLCAPSRGSLMTGRYPFRLGLSEEKAGGELPLSEVTLAEELKSVGYRTNLIGKWHLGMSSAARTPMHRGFDFFYGFYNGFVDYWTKEYTGYLDLQNGEMLETDPNCISSELHNAYLMSWKTIDTINNHATLHKDQPLFLYVAMQLIHEDWAAPALFIERCNQGGASSDRAVYCAMNLMIDEVVTNITCALNNNGMADNTVLILASDNGGVQTMPGNNHPLKGSKGSFFRGGLSAPAFIHGSIVPAALQGSEYNGEMHVTDWLPTLMGIATNYQWTGGLYGQELDGMDMWPTILAGAASPHTEIIHYMDEYGNCSMQLDMIKYDYNYFVTNRWEEPEFVFTEDQRSDLVFPLCNVPSLIDYTTLAISGATMTEEMAMKEADMVFLPYIVATNPPSSAPQESPTKRPTGRTNGPSSTDGSDIMTTSAAAVTGATGGPLKVGNPNNPKATAAAATVTGTATTATTIAIGGAKTASGSSVSTDGNIATTTTISSSLSTSSPGITAGTAINTLPAADLTGPASEILLTGPVSGATGPVSSGLTGPVSGALTGPVSSGLTGPVSGATGPINGDLTGPVSEILLSGPVSADLTGPTSNLADVFIEPSIAITSGSSLSTIRNQESLLGTAALGQDEVEEGVLESNAAADAAASAKINKNHTIFAKLDTNGLISLALISLACVSLLSVVWCTVRTVTQLRSNSRSKSISRYGDSSVDHESSEHRHHGTSDSSKPYSYLVYNKNNNSNSNSQLMNQSSTSNSAREREEESEIMQSPYGACERDALLWQDSNI